MKIKLKILTPVHIGSGEEISPIEYFIYDSKNNKICSDFSGDKFIRLDMDGLFNDPDFKPLMEKFIESAKSQRYIDTLLPQKLLLKYQLYSLNISTSAKGTNPMAVKSFIKSAGRVYIPGSSLKGSILSAIIYKIAKYKRITDLQDYETLLSEVLTESSNRKSGRFSRWFDVSDSDFRLPVDSLEISLAKVEGAHGGSKLPVLFEVLKQKVTFNLEIKTSIDSIDKFGKLSEKEILAATNEFYNEVLQKENQYNKIKQALPKVSPNSFLVRLGQGSTCLSTSLLILAEKLNIKNYSVFRPRIKGRQLSPIKTGEQPGTKKLISGTTPFGWAEVSCA